MGHYYADMMCDTCGKVRCMCPLPKSQTDDYWVVTDDFRVLRAIDYQHEREDSMAFMDRMLRKHYKKRREAEEAARVQCEEAIGDARRHLLKLEKLLKTERPWEKK